jgi:putative membrane protein
MLVKDAASINLMEMQLGRVAREKGASFDVREFGNRLEREHGRANEDLKAIAMQKNLKLPRKLERRHAQMVAQLAGLSGGEFDRAFLRLMVKNHGKSIARFKKALRKVKDSDLIAWTNTMIPMLEQHLRRARELAQVLGVE